MDISEKLVAERRARLAAERSLEQMKTELYRANENLSLHARNLSTEIASTQEEVLTVRTEAADLKERYEKAETNLRNAKSAITIAERRLWDSLETIRDGFAVFGPDELLIAANRSYLAVFDGLEMVRPGIALSELFALLAEEGIVDTGGLRAAAWKQMMLDRCHQHRIENAVLKIWNGTYIKLVDRRTRDGDLVTLALNITDQMVREQQLKEASERAEAANRAKSAFLANMSHEIRTPMNGVIGMADILAETEMDEEQKSYLETIRSSGEALLVIINDVLDYSKIEAEKINLKPRPFDLERCIHDVVTLLSPTAREKGFEIAVDYDLFMPTEYNGDAGRIRQVLTNLVGNAIKFTNDGHVTIQVVGLPVDAEDAYRIHVTVQDTGIGIPEDKLDDVFREFQQVENERNRAHDGTGLGLAITQRLIALMEGEVWVDSTEHEGSVFGFHITLPVVTEVHPSDISAPGWMDRAIVIDRDGMNRSILIKQLGLMGLRSVVADSLDGLAELRPGPRDVVLIGADADDDVVAAARSLRECFAPAAVFLLSDPGRGPRGHAEFNGSMQRPVLRSDITRSLNSIARPEALTTQAPEIEAPEPSSRSVPEAAALSDRAAPADPPEVNVAAQAEPAPTPDAPAALAPASTAEAPNTPRDIAPAETIAQPEPAPSPETLTSEIAAPDTTPPSDTGPTAAPPHLDPSEVAPLPEAPASEIAAPEITPPSEVDAAVAIAQPHPIHVALPPETPAAETEAPEITLPSDADAAPAIAQPDPSEVAPPPETPAAEIAAPATTPPINAGPAETTAPPNPSEAPSLQDAPTSSHEAPASEIASPPEAAPAAAPTHPETSEVTPLPEASPPEIAPTEPTPPQTAPEPDHQAHPEAAALADPAPATPAPARIEEPREPRSNDPHEAEQRAVAEVELPEPFAATQNLMSEVLQQPPTNAAPASAEPHIRAPEPPAPTPPAQPDVAAEGQFDADFATEDPEFELVGTPPEQTLARPMRVLIAEDNRTNRIVIEKMMKSLNVELIFAENGLEAIDHFQWQRPDIIFTDISMPKMDGKEAARRIRQIEAEENLPSCPIVAITAHAMEGDADDILAAGIDHYLTKPVKKAALTEHVLKAQPEGTLPVTEPSTEAVA